MDQQYRRQPLTQDLQIAQIAHAVLLLQTRSLDGARERGKHDGRLVRVLLHQLVQDQVLGSAGEVVEAEGDALGRGESGGGRGGGVVGAAITVSI